MTFKKQINRIRVVLAEQDRTNKWLAEKLGKNRTTVSRWCTNDMQPVLGNISGDSCCIKCRCYGLIG